MAAGFPFQDTFPSFGDNQHDQRPDSHVIVEVLFGAEPTTYAKNMGGHRVRIDLYVVARPIPAIIGIGQLVLHLERMIRIEPQVVEVQLNPAGVGMRRTQIDDDQYDVGSIRRALAITNQLIIICRVEMQALIPVKRRILSTDLIHEADEVL